MNRGSTETSAERLQRPPAFNEAPIHESGKYEWRIDPSSYPGYAFNEAPIHESGKCARMVR